MKYVRKPQREPRLDDTVWQAADLLRPVTDALNWAQAVVERHEFGVLAKIPRTFARLSREITRISTVDEADPPR
jgi:hypothetical protein